MDSGKKRGKERIITFLDEKLKAEETSTLIYAINQLQKKGTKQP